MKKHLTSACLGGLRHGERCTDEEGCLCACHGDNSTMTLTDAHGVVRFERGPGIDELPEEQARIVFGDAVYEQWREMQKNPATAGRVTITRIGR